MKKNKTNKIKIAISILFLSVVLCTALYSKAPSNSSFIALDSPFYEDFDRLMNSLGLQANYTRPYTYAEANLYLSQIESAELNERERYLYEIIKEEIKVKEKDDNVVAFNYDITLSPEIYLHTNLSFQDPVYFMNYGDQKPTEFSYQTSEKYMTWDRDRMHFFDADLELSFADRVTLLFRAPITNTVHTGSPSGSSYLMSNIPFLSSLTSFDVKNFQDFSMNFPYRAYISIADSWYSIQLGRERYNYGSGESGNFVIDSSTPYHSGLSISFFSRTFKYNFLLSFFPHPSQYIETDSQGNMLINERGDYVTNVIFDQNTNAFTGLKFFMVHRFEWTMAHGKVRMALTEGMIYQNDLGGVDLQVLNPMMFFHNMYIAGNSNSILQLELDAFLARGINQRIVVTIDDFNIPFESEDGSEARPNAIGAQYGIRTSHVLGPGFIESNAEVTYMSPYFYLRDGKSNTSYPVDFVVPIRNQRSGAGIYDLYSIGYENGGDQTIALVNVSYSVPYNYKVKFDTEYRLFGHNNLTTVYMKGKGEGPLTHMLKFKLSGEYYISRDMKVGCELSDAIYFNYKNEGGNTQNDFILKLSYIWKY